MKYIFWNSIVHFENVSVNIIKTATDRLRASMAHDNTCTIAGGEPFKSDMTSYKQAPTESQST